MMSKSKALLSAIVAVILALSFCVFANADAKAKTEVKLTGGLAKLSDYIPKDFAKYLAENFKEVKLTEIAKTAGMKVSLENKKDSVNPYIDIWVVDNLQPAIAAYAKEESVNFGSTAYKIDIPNTDKVYYGYLSLEYYYGTPYFTLTLITDIGDEKLIEYVFFFKTEKIKIGSSGKTMLIPYGSKKGKSDRESAICCYDYDTDGFSLLPQKITIYEWPCKDIEQFEKDILEAYKHYDGVGMSFVPLDHGQAVMLQYPEENKHSDNYSEDYAFFKDGKAYSVEFDVEPSTSDVIHPIVNSID